jgi:predicted nucleic acid-binding protein
MMALLIGAGEVISILVRRKNAGALSTTAYGQAVTELQNEVINSADFQLKSVEDSLVHASFAFIERHSLTTTDTIVLRSALDVANILRSAGDDLVLVGADARLLRAAQLEGLVTFNRELDSQAQLDALIAS